MTPSTSLSPIDVLKGPLVSVVIPVYNGSKYIGEAIASVRKQNYEPLEIVLIDDGSTDDTPAVVRSCEDIIYIRQEHLGVAAARNTGIEKSRGELIAFLDADDYWAADKLYIQVGCLLKHPHIGYILGRQRNFLEPGTNRPFWLREEHLIEEHTGFLPTLLIRRQIFDTVGLFNTDFTISEDVEWFSRLKDAGIPMMVVPEVVLHRRIHDANLSYQSQGPRNPALLRALRSSIRHKSAKDSISRVGGHAASDSVAGPNEQRKDEDEKSV